MERNIQHFLKSSNPSIKILFVDDEEFSREKLLRVLRRRFPNVLVAINGVEGYLLYQKYQPDLIIADIKMNRKSGLEMINKIRDVDDKVQIIVTAAQDDDFLIHSFENKVNYFVLKPIDLDQLLRAIQKSIIQIQVETEFDRLTNSYNRHKFNEILDREINRSERYGHLFSIIRIDIDRFNHVIDQCSRQERDQIIIKISTIAQQRIRECDVFARWGGEEFIILTPETNKEGAMVLAESLRILIQGFDFERVGPITCSLGVAEFSTGKTKRELILEAEQALYLSIKKGGNCVTTASKDHD